MPAFQDLTGQVFGRLKVIERAVNRGRATRWLCLCECGNTSEPSASHLKSGHTISCGCVTAEKIRARATTHGGYETPEHRVWASMLSRIRNPNSPGYERYGGRGISLCDRWLRFENFLSDMGPRPEGTSIDRINNSLGYFPENCRWATATEQGRNKGNNRLLEYQGQVKTISEWAGILGIRYTTLYMRVTHLNMSVKEAFEKPVGRWAK